MGRVWHQAGIRPPLSKAAPGPPPGERVKGFTLIEVLVGLALLALVSVMSWRGLDGMLRSQQRLAERGQALASLQTGLAQWTLDLDQAAQTPYLNMLAWDGRQLRIVRRALSEEALLVVAWGLRPAGAADGPLLWKRWQSPPVRERSALLAAWNAAAQGLDQAEEAVTLVPAQAWELHFDLGAGWRPAAVGTATPVLEAPAGVRLRLSLPPGPEGGGLSGPLQLDWANPGQNRGRS